MIGADGLHSNIRRLAFGEEEQFVRDLGMYLCVFSVPNYLELDRVEVQYSEVGRVASVWSTRDEDSAKACFGFASSRAPSVSDPHRAIGISSRTPSPRCTTMSGGRCPGCSS